MSEKVVGYMLLVIGMFLIIFTLVNVYGLATGSVKPFQIFQFEGITLDLGQLAQGSVKLPPELEKLGVTIEEPTGPTTQEIFPSDILNQSTNFFVHILILGFVASAGQKIASIGVQMIRPLVIKTSERKIREGSILEPPFKS